jgi:hypothetical protein
LENISKYSFAKSKRIPALFYRGGEFGFERNSRMFAEFSNQNFLSPFRISVILRRKRIFTETFAPWHFERKFMLMTTSRLPK